MKRKLDFHFIFILLGASLWGTAGVFVRTAEGTAVSEMQIVLFRAVFSSLILAAVILIKGKKLFVIKLRDIWLFAASGIFSIVMFNFCYYKTMSLTSLSAAAVLLYTAPFFVMIMSVFVFRQRLTFKKCFACVTAFVGCCFVTGVFSAGEHIGGKAVVFGLLTGFGYSLYTVFGELLLRRGYNSLTITFYTFVFALVGSLPFVNPAETLATAAADPYIVWVLFLMAAVNTVLPYLLYTAGLSGVDPSAAPIIATVEPVVATLIGVFVYNETLTAAGVLGIILVLMSVVILNLKPRRIKVTANAKVNLALSVTGKRADGYHEIDTVMQSVTLNDTVTIRKDKKLTVVCSDSELNGGENIACRAAKLFFENSGLKNRGAKIYIEKRIPKAAGLGGGSADAAAVLCGLDRLYGTGLSYDTLCRLALELGADVPFFIEGGTQRAGGTGEKLTKLTAFSGGVFLLARQGEKISTAEMYSQLDSKEYIKPDINALVSALGRGTFDGLLKNSFSACWQDDFEERLEKTGASTVSLSGSGPYRFALFADIKSAVRAKAELAADGIESIIAEPCDFALKFE